MDLIGLRGLEANSLFFFFVFSGGCIVVGTLERKSDSFCWSPYPVTSLPPPTSDRLFVLLPLFIISAALCT